jgi:hypothetical protein
MGGIVSDAAHPGKGNPCTPRFPATPLRKRSGLPFIELKTVGAEDVTLLIERIFASDRQAVPKGMIEVVL